MWNGLTPDRFPEVIVRVAAERDIPQVLDRAREEGLRVSVRSGGHNWSGSQLRDGALLLDLSRLQHCAIDAGSSTATVGPGVTGSTFAAQLSRHGLAFPTGHCPTVALGGYLLSGGLGWNSRELGPACQYVEEIEAVTADGSTVTCSETENADLFWAARGAGPGFFAVVTRFRLRLLPHPGSIMTASFTFALNEAEQVGEWALRAARDSPPSVETNLVLTASGPARGSSGPGPRLRIESSAFAATPEAAGEALAPLAGCPFAERALDLQPAQPTAFRSLYEGAGSTWPPEHRYAVDTLWSTETYETQLARSARLIARSPSEHSLVLIPVEPVAPDPDGLRDMAFSALGESYVAPFAVWADPAADETNTRWLREGMDELDPHGTGSHYIAETDLEAGASRARRSFAPADWERLRQVRARWDPSGLFQDYLTP
ncbi:FAD linked oxidase-like protein [Streptomyces abyssalis]|uniref:FAD linked oxidase-like protein n=1 Tax=Streptomyces abyssalis TaxID=933944 RepID=A0A1E7JRC0_9ACTN|nr:FAD linked oxidase-like protein [Streptomyces abyssalis]OEU95426.1 FAD linked oxidase-like protein [Streptomyces abyssalis]OEV07832.1 FAD linked oxidase-like protein [Streptomyces nanshensis]